MITNKKWKLKEQVSDDLEKQLLYSFGIKTEVEVKKYFEPDFEEDLHDPFLMADMDKAVDRILSAIEKNEKVVLFGDYDADGVCGTAIFYTFFKKIGFENFEIYIPDRHKEGYGLNFEAIDEFIKNKVQLIITNDCGVTDFDEIEKINENKIDVVVTDHHLVPNTVPPAFAVVDAKREGDEYPFKELCGAGVSFKVVEAIIAKGDFNIVEGWHKWLLDLVAIATVADMVPLLDENRVLVKYGLKVLGKTQRPGLLALYQNLKIKKEDIEEDDLGFFIGPRINTAGRMEHATLSLNLLTTENMEEAKWIAGRLEEKNIERKQVAEEVIQSVAKKLEEEKELPEVLFFGDKDWQIGVLGIIAAKLCDKYNRPVFLWGQGDNKHPKGSCRSDGSVNLVELMKKIDGELFEDFGGHAGAGGFSLKEGVDMEEVKKSILKAYQKTKIEKEEDLLLIEKEVVLEDVNWGFVETVEKFKPFGVENPKPVFLFKDLEVFGVRFFGNGGIHLGLDFQIKKGKISAIGFFAKETLNGEIKMGDKIDLIASVERNNFMGRNEIRLRIVDFELIK